MNDYLRNLEKIEFVITMACTGKCKHCSEGDHDGFTEHIDADVAAESIKEICAHYDIKTVMTFGGEPLLYPDVVCTILKTASDLGIEKRQLITNGYFSNNPESIEAVVKNLNDSGVNDILLSVDAFHQEYIPLDPVFNFAQNAVQVGIPVRLQPAWLGSSDDLNSYNDRTREVIQKFEPLHISLNQGNVIFPSGNAIKYLHEYFDEKASVPNPYEEDPKDIKTISFDPDGGVLNGNIYQTDILEIMENYKAN
ncbi:radical SAM protein [Butyrivibrio sp. AC2005]|uniref:radical SAM protein n=1 Tax=Butyrivibrio sp. AC2005 TaxID=1280672 RepID=UPI0003FA962E|nr:radical SAM protein [Butyrivibrio sp. AC2005]